MSDERRTFTSRTPSGEPELLELDHHPEGVKPLGWPASCAWCNCNEPPIFVASYSDSSFAYYCEQHGLEEAEQAGLEETTGT